MISNVCVKTEETHRSVVKSAEKNR